MNGKMYAADLMTRQVRSVTVTGSLSEAMRIMDEGGFSQVPVIDGERPVRLLTERDARHALRDGKAERPLSEVASPLPCMLSPEAPLSEVLAQLSDYDTLLIVQGKGDLAGIITYWDVLRVARPHLLVAEVELLLRRMVAEAYRAKYGQDWWGHLRGDLRQRAEEEHQRDKKEGNSSPEHMLGHTSFWALIEAYSDIRPDLSEEQVASFHKVRVWRNQVAHLYVMTEQELAQLIRETLAMRDFLEEPSSPVCPT